MSVGAGGGGEVGWEGLGAGAGAGIQQSLLPCRVASPNKVLNYSRHSVFFHLMNESTAAPIWEWPQEGWVGN